jgi:hypothetical protein
VPQIGQGLVDGGMDGGSVFGFDLVCLEVWKAGGVVETCLTYSKSKRRRMEQCVCSLATVVSLTRLGCFFLFVCLECKVLDDASGKNEVDDFETSLAQEYDGGLCDRRLIRYKRIS